MLDQSFNRKNLAKKLEKRDFLKDKYLSNDTYRNNLILKASEFSKFGIFSDEIFKVKRIKNKLAYELIGIDKNLVLRKANDNLRNIYKVKQNDRDFMIKQLKVAVSEGIEFSLYQLDIKNFYESLNQNHIISEIERNETLSYDTKLFINKFIRAYSNISKKGLPRGISISSTLSEIIMKDFDNELNNNPNVYYYFRFVDDIIIITDKKEGKTFIKDLQGLLPKGLVFHDKKDKKNKLTLNKATKKDELKLAGEFDYLGYNFKIFDPLKKDNENDEGFRITNLDISKKKVDKIKSRLLVSFINFAKNNDFKLLSDRVKFLSSNFKLKDKRTEIDVMSGIFFNYKRVDYSFSNSLKLLDSFLYSCVSSNNICGVKINLTAHQKRVILNYSFRRGFKYKKQINLTPSRQLIIQRTWLNV